MSAETAIVWRIRSDAGVAAIVGDRVYPQRRPQSTKLPAIVYRLTATATVATNDGPALTERRFAVECLAGDFAAALELAELVVDLIDGWRLDSDGVQGVFLQDVADEYEEPTDGSEWGTWARVLDFQMWGM